MNKSGLSNEQVLLEAKNHWRYIKSTTRHDLDAFYTSGVRLTGFTAFNALKKVEIDDYPGDVFWETADWKQLEQDLIAMIDVDEAPNSSYEQQMRIRNGQHVSAPRSAIEL